MIGHFHGSTLNQRALLIAAAVTLGGCGSDDGGSTSSIEPRLSVIEQRIFQPSCTFSSCHGADSPKAGLSLTGSTYEKLVNQGSTQVSGRFLVLPEDPDGSYLLEKLSDDSPTFGTRMPYASDPLPAEKIAAIRKWIESGAADD